MLRTNKIVDTKSILESRLKKSIIEFNYLISILLQNNYFKQNYSIVLNQIIIDKEIIKNPLYNFWIKTIKEIIRYNGINKRMITLGISTFTLLIQINMREFLTN